MVVFIFEVFFIFEVIFIFEVVFIFKVIFILKVVLFFEVVLIFEVVLYPCEECGYRTQDKLNLNTHIKECHNSTTQSVNQLDSTFEEFGIKRLPEYSKRIRQNFGDLIIEDEGNIEVMESDTEYSDEKLLIDDYDQTSTICTIRKIFLQAHLWFARHNSQNSHLRW